jgi:hypothetical protein
MFEVDPEMTKYVCNTCYKDKYEKGCTLKMRGKHTRPFKCVLGESDNIKDVTWKRV